MKKLNFNQTSWQSIVSAIILGVFVWLAVGSISIIGEFFNSENRTRRPIGNGYYEEVHKIDGDPGEIETIQGKNNEYGNWQGKTIITFDNIYYDIHSREEVYMKNGKKHGVSITTFPDKPDEIRCYDMGELVDCETQSGLTANKESAYDIFVTRYPNILQKLQNLYGLSEEKLKDYLSISEEKFLEKEFEFESYFDTIYQTIREELLETEYDSIVVANEELSFYQGVELSKYDEFRIAVINKYLWGNSNLFNTIKQVHSNYLNLINSYGYIDIDFEQFCHVFDSLMTSFGPLDLNDPNSIDSLDTRMVRVLLQMTGYDILYGLKSLYLNNKNLSVSSFLKSQYDMAKTYETAATPTQVAQLVVGLVYYEYIEGDKIRKALMEYYAYKKGIVLFPTVTTVFESRNSSSGVTISGNVTDDGGGDITTRGFVWGTVYNPNYRDNVIAVDPGTGLFQSDINGLSEGVTYYVRSFATNSAGTKYGNCVEFTTEVTTDINENISNEFEFTIYPNPAKDEATLRFKGDFTGNWELIVTDLQGRTVYRNKHLEPVNNSVRLYLYDFDNGVYNCKFVHSDFIITRKLIVMH